MIPIRIESLSKIFGKGQGEVRAVDNVSLSVEAGEFFFLLGPSGCGKTTLLRMIAGLIEPAAGRIFFAGKDVTRLPVEKRNTAMVFQNYALWPHMTVAKNVQFGPKMQGVDRRRRREIMQEQLARVEMEQFAPRKPNQLSGGQQQRVAVARALAARPDCLLLDEPLSNLDARLRLHMRGQLRRLVKETGTTGLYVTHDQKEALSMADRIAVMRMGKVVQVGTPEALYHTPRTRFVADFLGEANFLEGRIRTAKGRRLLETACGTVELPETHTSPNESGTVNCCVRPENVAIPESPDRTPQGASRLEAEIVEATFLGEIRQYVCRMADGRQWRVTCLSRRRPHLEPDGKATLSIRGEDVVILED